MQRRFRNSDATIETVSDYIYPGLSCAVIVGAGKLVAVYHRPLQNRWGYVGEFSSLPSDVVSADVWQCRDGIIRLGMFCVNDFFYIAIVIFNKMKISDGAVFLFGLFLLLFLGGAMLV